MRPIKLTLKNFGTYVEKTEIDLSLLDSRGLYLISGDTGAGKTTIFDGIVYALFGDLSTEQRDPIMLRSRFAAPEEETLVELVFEHKNRLYRIKREFSLKKAAIKAKKAQGESSETLYNASDFKKSALFFENYDPQAKNDKKDKGITISRSSKGKPNEIEKLLGLNRDQFKQVALIAQNEFMTLLQAKTDKRKEVFRSLFYTEKYQRFQKRLKEKHLDQKKEMDGLENLKKRLEAELISTFGFEEGPLETAQVDEAIQKIQERIAKGKKQLEDIQKELDGLNQRIGTLELQKQIQDSVKQARKTVETKEPELEKQKEVQKALDEKKETFDQKRVELSELSKTLETLQKIRRLEKDTSALQHSLDEADEKITQQQKENEKLQDDLDQKKQFLLQNESLQQNLHGLLLLEEEFKTLDDLLTDRKNLEQKDRDSLARYQHLETDYKEASETFKKAFLSFSANQAGLLAAALEENEPCPVCGSLDHPHPARMAKTSYTQQDLDDLKEEEDRLSKDLLDQSAACKEIKTRLEQNQIQIEKLQSLLKDQNRDEISSGISRIQKAIKECEKIRRILPQLEKKMAQKREILEDLLIKRQQTASSLEQSRMETELLKKQTRFQDETKTLSRIASLKEEIADYQKECRDVEQSISGLEKDLFAARAILQQHKDLVEMDLEKELEALTSKQQDYQIQKETLSESLQSDRLMQGQGQKKAGEYKDLIKKIDLKSPRLAALQELSETMNGNITGKEKVDLETYVQTSFLDRVLEQANQILMRLTKRQYELRRADLKDKKHISGLDINVYDYYSESDRDIDSLSGGESFLAALALAMGLSEAASNEAGVQIESLFMDEGFGSLDNTLLRNAVDNLETVAKNRQIGIISHVEDLGDMIDQKLIVKKGLGTKGSRIEYHLGKQN